MKKEAGETQEKKNSLRSLIIFCVIVSAVILISLIYRIVILVQNSKFDGESGIIISLMQDDHKKAALYAFDPTKGTVSVVVVTGPSPLPNLKQVLGLPIEGEVKTKQITETTQFPFIFNSPSFFLPSGGSELSVLDAFRLWYLSKTFPERDKTVEKVQISDTVTFTDEEFALFLDSQLENEKQTIAIVNGTAISGLGGRLEKQITHVGGYVISTTTSHTPIQKSRILYYGEPTYTVKKLLRMTHFPIVERSEGGISDILIEIGEDQQRTESF